ncbi:MAG: hypothetical protein KF848_09240 [Nitrospira sp.]|nr:hypothetical protein [Nitrospira sp.]
MSEICRLAARFRVTLFLSHPERDPRSQQLYNAVFAIGSDGPIGGQSSEDQRPARRIKPGPPGMKQPRFALRRSAASGFSSVRTLIPQGLPRVF